MSADFVTKSYPLKIKLERTQTWSTSNIQKVKDENKIMEHLMITLP